MRELYDCMNEWQQLGFNAIISLIAMLLINRLPGKPVDWLFDKIPTMTHPPDWLLNITVVIFFACVGVYVYGLYGAAACLLN